MGCSSSTMPADVGQVPEGKIRLCLATHSPSHNAGYTIVFMKEMVKAQPDKFESFIYIDSRKKYQAFLPTLKVQFDADQQETHAAHKTSPFCWIEMSDGTKTVLGGGDSFRKWGCEQIPGNAKMAKMNPGNPKKPQDAKPTLFSKGVYGTATK